MSLAPTASLVPAVGAVTFFVASDRGAAFSQYRLQSKG